MTYGHPKNERETLIFVKLTQRGLTLKDLYPSGNLDVSIR